MSNSASGDASFTTRLRRMRALANVPFLPDQPGQQLDAVDLTEARLGWWLDAPVPAAPVDFAVASVTDTSAALTWVPVGPGYEYTVQYRVTGTADWSTWTARTLTVGATVTGLTPGWPYDFLVTAYDCCRGTAAAPVSAAASISGADANAGYLVDLYASTSVTAFLSTNGDYTLWPAAAAPGLRSAVPMATSTMLSSAHVLLSSGSYVFFAERVRASFPAVSTGTYGFALTADDGGALFIDGVAAISGAWVEEGATTYSTTVALSAGIHTLDARYYQDGGPYALTLSWQPPGATSWTPLDAVVFQTAV
jgi:hypothetical protein